MLNAVPEFKSFRNNKVSQYSRLLYGSRVVGKIKLVLYKPIKNDVTNLLGFLMFTMLQVTLSLGVQVSQDCLLLVTRKIYIFLFIQ